MANIKKIIISPSNARAMSVLAGLDRLKAELIKKFEPTNWAVKEAAKKQASDGVK